MSSQQKQQQQPSRLHSLTEQATGVLKENVGHLLGNKEMEAQGKIQRLKGEIEMEDARMAMGGRRGSLGQELIESVKEVTQKVNLKGATSKVFEKGELSGLTTKVQGLTEQATGTIKENLGKVIGNKELIWEGKAQREHGARLLGSFHGGPVMTHLPYGLLCQINNREWKLNHVETVDKTRPFFKRDFKNWHMARNNRRTLFDEIKRGHFRLRHVNVNDKTMLNWKRDFKNWHMARDNRRTLFDEINRGNFRLKHVKTCDKTKPNLKTFTITKLPNKLLREIRQGGFSLRHVNTVDKCKPKFDKNLHIKKFSLRKDLLEEVKEPHRLKHVQTVDKAKPMIDKGVKLHKMNRRPFLEEVRTGTHLKPARMDVA
jgi:uncharacterized protein YjbJ (UPF0337 family)